MKTFRNFFFSVTLAVLAVACNTPRTVPQPQTGKTAVDQPKAIEVNGETLHYIEKGQGEPLIFIHGGVGDYRLWTSRVQRFSENYRVIAYSRRYAYPNEQKFDSLADYSQVVHAKDLYAFIKKLNLKKVNAVGHSYGARTALAMALEHPEVVNALVLGEPPVFSVLAKDSVGMESLAQFFEQSIRPAAQAFRESDNERGVELFLRGVLGNEFKMSEVPPEIRQGWMDNVLEIWGQTINEIQSPIDPEKIKRLDVPVLLIMGDRSPIWFRKVIVEMNKILPESEIVILENSSHGLYFDNPEDADKAIAAFLENQ